ncbi:MAG: PcfJ domain-containing protein [Pseudomonadota bacterium]
MTSIDFYKPQAIKDYLKQQADGDEQVAKGLNDALYKSLLKRPESAEKLEKLPGDADPFLKKKWEVSGPFSVYEFKPDKVLNGKVRHIKDWLVSAQMNNERPSLEGFNLESACKAADRYFNALNKKNKSLFLAENDKDTEAVMSFDGGSRIVKLLTPDALKREGAEMGHCIGGGSYDKKLKDGSCIFYSLRDARNNPHATFEVEVKNKGSKFLLDIKRRIGLAKGDILLQCKGKEDKPPIQEYMPCVQGFVTKQQFDLQENALYTGLIKSDGKYFSIYELPENLFMKGFFDLSNCRSLTKLPDNLSVEGNFALNDCTGLVKLPENLSVGKNFYLRRCTSLTEIPDNLSVKGILNLNGCTSLTKLPNKLTVGGLELVGCTSLTKLPDDLSVKGDFLLTDCTGLTKLPDNLSVKGSLILWNCIGLTEIPDNLSVAGNLLLKGCTGLTSIPRSLLVTGKIITDLGDFMTVAEAASAFDKKFGNKSAGLKPPAFKA